MKLTLLLIICSFTCLSAQVGLLVEDETDKGFFLGINGYLQNAESATKWHSTGLDTVPFVVQIESDTVDFIKTIHLRDKGHHRYVLTYNSRGQLKLRYRGSLSRPAENAVTYSQDLKWPEEWVPRGNKPPPAEVLPAVAASSNTQEKPVPTQAVAPNAGDEPDTLLLPGNKVVTMTEDTVQAPPPPEPEISPFEKLISKLEKQEFEFERQRVTQEYLETHRLSVEELGEIFSLLKYDNTRLQLFEAAYPRLINPREAEKLIAGLEYDVSKQKLKKQLHEK